MVSLRTELCRKRSNTIATKNTSHRETHLKEPFGALFYYPKLRKELLCHISHREPAGPLRSLCNQSPALTISIAGRQGRMKTAPTADIISHTAQTASAHIPPAPLTRPVLPCAVRSVRPPEKEVMPIYLSNP